MKFYEVQDEYGDYTAVIWAMGVDEAMDIYRRDVANANSLSTVEMDIDEVYDLMVEASETDKEHDYTVFGVMGRVQAIISSTVPVVVLTRGVD